MPIIPSAGATASKGAYVPLGSVKLGSSGGAVFTNIPQIYQDLMVVCSTRDTNPSFSPVIFNYLNSDSSAVYSFTTLSGNNNGASSGRVTSTNSFGTGIAIGGWTMNNLYALNIIHILNYANTTTFKTVLYQSAAETVGYGTVRLSVGTYRSTSGITSVWVNPGTSFVGESTAQLYAIRSVGQ